ncbi:MAG: hypothetical protein LQ348_001267 [Seirophora lacunosa]|nr:MAG: hypothetical protein LQ348_001267 [Seirophora lacunosa]
MAEAETTNTSARASSASPPTPQEPPEVTAITRKTRVIDFLEPDSPRKRPRSGGNSAATPATPPIQETLTTSTTPKYSVSPPTLTAAQALLDQRKHRRSQEAALDRQTSPNTARTALLALQGKQMVSEAGSENAVKPANSTGEPIAAVVTATQQPQAPHVGVAPMQQNVTLSSNFGPPEEISAATVLDGNGGPVASPGRIDDNTGNDEGSLANQASQRPRRQETDPGEGRSDKALTFPGPLPNFPQADRRRNTHSGFGRDSDSKSPSSTKKHQWRRSSLGGDEPDQDESMHGMMFSGEASHEPEKMDVDADPMDSRKGSLPSIKGSVASMNGSVPSMVHHSPADGHTSYATRQPSTYPPIAGPQPNPGGLYPPMASPGAGSSTSNSPRQTSFNQTSASSTFAAPSQNVFAQGGAMTESPKPLSPSSHQLGHPDSGISRNRSPSSTQQYQQQQFGRRASTRNSPPPMALPLMPPGGHPGAPHLPSLPGLPPPDLRFTLPSQPGAPPQMHPNTQGNGPNVSSPGYHSQSGNNSLSSQSAEGSSQNPYGQGSDRLWAYIRSLEVKVDRLQEEIGSLKSQLPVPR